MSAHATICTTGKFFAIPRYAPLMAPVPMTPTLTGSNMVGEDIGEDRRRRRVIAARLPAYGGGGSPTAADTGAPRPTARPCSQAVFLTAGPAMGWATTFRDHFEK